MTKYTVDAKTSNTERAEKALQTHFDISKTESLNTNHKRTTNVANIHAKQTPIHTVLTSHSHAYRLDKPLKRDVNDEYPAERSGRGKNERITMYAAIYRIPEPTATKKRVQSHLLFGLPSASSLLSSMAHLIAMTKMNIIDMH